VFGHCRQAILGEPALWPGDEIGARMGEYMLQYAFQRAQELVQQAMAEKGIVVPEGMVKLQ